MPVCSSSRIYVYNSAYGVTRLKNLQLEYYYAVILFRCHLHEKWNTAAGMFYDHRMSCTIYDGALLCYIMCILVTPI